MSRLEPFVEQVSEAFGVAPDMVFQLNLALDEALANSVNYAYGADEEGEIELEASKDADSIVFRLIDRGVPFDPTDGDDDVDISSSAEERPIGGLGIFLIKQMMDEVRYMRQGDMNILTMKKQIF